MPTTIRELYGLNLTEGEVGIEIEMEGTNLPPAPLGWEHTRDGSCRGESLEYVLKKPVLREGVKPYLDTLAIHFKAMKHCKLSPSDRCGVHVHINVQSFTFNQVISYASLYLVLENLLIKWCGEDREGNLFCLRARDAEFLVERIIHSLPYNSFAHSIGRDQMRYASINFEAIPKYGSLEFRAMKTLADFVEPISTWTNVLLNIKDKSLTYENPMHIVEDFSRRGPEAFVTEVLKEYTPLFYSHELEPLVFDGMRRVQDIAFAQQMGIVKDEENKAKVKFKMPPPPELRPVFDEPRPVEAIRQEDPGVVRWIEAARNDPLFAKAADLNDMIQAVNAIAQRGIDGRFKKKQAPARARRAGGEEAPRE